MTSKFAIPFEFDMFDDAQSASKKANDARLFTMEEVEHACQQAVEAYKTAHLAEQQTKSNLEIVALRTAIEDMGRHAEDAIKEHAHQALQLAQSIVEQFHHCLIGRNADASVLALLETYFGAFASKPTAYIEVPALDEFAAVAEQIATSGAPISMRENNALKRGDARIVWDAGEIEINHDEIAKSIAAVFDRAAKDPSTALIEELSK